MVAGLAGGCLGILVVAVARRPPSGRPRTSACSERAGKAEDAAGEVAGLMTGAGHARVASMFDAYRQVLRVPGARAFAAAGFLLRLPLAVYPVGLVLLVSLNTGDYARGGLLTAAYILGLAVGNQLLSGLADARGQRFVLLPAAAVHALAVLTLVALVQRTAPVPAQVVAGAAVGLSFVPVGALVRARWVAALRTAPGELGTALSLESALDEISFVVGPLLAAGLATGVHPAAPLVLTTVLVLAGAAMLHLLRGSTPEVHQRGHGRAAALPPVTAGIVLVAACVGVTLVSIDLAAIAFVGQAGAAPWTGAVVGCFALGSGVAGFAYGLRSWRRPVERRLPVVAVVFAVLPVLLLTAGGVPALAGALFVVGMGTAPLLTTVFGSLERVVAPERLTEGLAWVSTGLNLGAGLAAPAVGAVADAAGARQALVIPVAVSLPTGVLAVLVARRVALRRGTSRRREHVRQRSPQMW